MSQLCRHEIASSRTFFDEVRAIMEYLPSAPILEFNPDTLQAVRKEFNLDKPERMAEAIDILDDWVKKQTHFLKKDFSRDYLERVIISTKGLVERAKVRLDRYCSYRTMMPNFFTDTDGQHVTCIYKELKVFVTHAHLPKMTPDNYRVYLFRLLTDNGASAYIFNYYKYILILSEYIKKNDYCNGFVLVMDYTDVSIMSFVTKINIVEFRQALTILMEGYGMRIKGIHFLTPSKMIDALISIFKSVLSEKISQRIHVHKTIDSLYDHVPQDILPEEYGGKERRLETLQEEWFDVVSSREYQDFLQELHQVKTIESCRQSGKFNEDYIGMPGSFRSLSVD